MVTTFQTLCCASPRRLDLLSSVVPPLSSFDGTMLTACVSASDVRRDVSYPLARASTAGSRRATDRGTSPREMEPDKAKLEKKEVCDSQLPWPLPLAFVRALCSFTRCFAPIPLCALARAFKVCMLRLRLLTMGAESDSCHRRLLSRVHSLEFWPLLLHPRLRHSTMTWATPLLHPPEVRAQ
jgi:hypothetical protein